MTMNKNILWMVFGAALLTGCPDEVMQQRRYVPADDPAADKSTVTEVSSDPAGGPKSRQVAVEERTTDDQAKEQTGAGESRQSRTAEFQPMTEKFDDSGVSSDDREVAAPGEYIVRSGDTLGKIAANHHVKLAALMKANKLGAKDAKRLRVGQKLTIPGGKAAAGTKSGSADPKAKNANSGKGGKKTTARETRATIQPGEYIIKAGDTPERIARRAKIRLSDLMAANNLTEDKAKRLRIGQKIVIPGKNGKSTAPAARTAVAKKTQNAGTGKPGDSKPAKGAETTAAIKPADSQKDDASILNDMENQSAGQSAAASTPAGTGAVANSDGETPLVEVSEDISITDFAKKYNTTPEALRGANPDGIGDTIKKGQLILIPR